MSLFELRGPQFLIVYVLLALVASGLLRGLRRLLEPGGYARLEAADPYAVAYLRGGHREVVRVALLSLVDRKRVEVSSSEFVRSASLKDDVSHREVDRLILARLTRRMPFTELAKDEALRATCQRLYAHPLERSGHVLGSDGRWRRWGMTALAVVGLEWLAGRKTMLALESGHANVQFLLLLMILVLVVFAFWAKTPRTPRGDTSLRALRSLYQRLRQRAAELKPGRQTGDLEWLAAVFGLSAVPAPMFPAAAVLHAQARSEADSDSSSDSGSSCGSSCGGGSGGGCGGCGS